MAEPNKLVHDRVLMFWSSRLAYLSLNTPPTCSQLPHTPNPTERLEGERQTYTRRTYSYVAGTSNDPVSTHQASKQHANTEHPAAGGRPNDPPAPENRGEFFFFLRARRPSRGGGKFELVQARAWTHPLSPTQLLRLQK